MNNKLRTYLCVAYSCDIITWLCGWDFNLIDFKVWVVSCQLFFQFLFPTLSNLQFFAEFVAFRFIFRCTAVKNAHIFLFLEEISIGNVPKGNNSSKLDDFTLWWYPDLLKAHRVSQASLLFKWKPCYELKCRGTGAVNRSISATVNGLTFIDQLWFTFVYATKPITSFNRSLDWLTRANKQFRPVILEIATSLIGCRNDK